MSAAVSSAEIWPFSTPGIAEACIGEEAAQGVSLVECPGGPSWNAEILKHPEASIFHTTAWADLIAQSYGHLTRFYRWESQGETVAWLPLTEVCSFLKGNRLVSMPFSDACPLLTQDFELGQDLEKDLIPALRKGDWDYLELRGGEPFSESHAGASFWTHEIDLQQDEEGLWQNLAGSVRRALRKAEAGNLEVRFETSAASMDAYYKLHLRTRGRHGVPPQPRHFFKELQRLLIGRGLGMTALAYLDGKPVAGAVFLSTGQNAIYKYGASDPAAWPLRPNNWIMWKAMLELKSQGVKQLSLGRTDLPHHSLRRFKRGWGGAERELCYSRIHLGQADQETLASRSRTLPFPTFLQAMPSIVHQGMGRLLYPHLD